MKSFESKLHAIERMIFRIGLIVLLLLTLIRVIWADLREIRVIVFSDTTAENIVQKDQK